MLQGGCYCGAIHYEAGGTPTNLTNCHCSICRRTTGAPFVTWFSVVRSTFLFTLGTPTGFRSTAVAARTFCPRWGRQLKFEHDDTPDEVAITTCSLDEPERLPPGYHIFIDGKPSWIRLADGLPEHPAARPAI